MSRSPARRHQEGIAHTLWMREQRKRHMARYYPNNNPVQYTKKEGGGAGLAVGAFAGGAIGTLVGGPVGGIIGAIIGGFLGDG